MKMLFSASDPIAVFRISVWLTTAGIPCKVHLPQDPALELELWLESDTDLWAAAQALAAKAAWETPRPNHLTQN